jgi:hypothetical protein
MNRRNIVQFKPEGVANIFSPTIRIQGGKTTKGNIDASNTDNINNTHVNYPAQRTVNTQRQNMANQEAIKSNHDELYRKLFGNLLDGDYINTGDDTYTSAGGPVPSGNTINYKKLTQVGLTNLADCIEKGGTCIHRDQCEPKNKIGRCFTDNYTCCRGKGISASTTSTTSTSGTNTGSATAESSEDSMSAGYLRWQTSMVGVGDSSPPHQVDQGMREQGTVRASSDYNYDSVTSVDDNMNPYFCATFCQGGSYDYITGKWKPRPCDGDCAKCSNCGKEPTQAGGSGTTQSGSVSDILFNNDRYTLSDLNRVEPNKYKTQINELKAQIAQNRNDDSLKQKLEALEKEAGIDNCYKLSDVECSRSKDCFNCMSEHTGENYSCKKHPNDNKVGVCDKKFASACVPIYKEGEKYKADTLGPFRDMGPYENGFDYYRVDAIKGVKDFKGLNHILEYPNKCKGPISASYSLDTQYQDAMQARGFDIPSTHF